jgi:hypothetical protein
MITVLNNQSLFDIAIQEFGSAEAAFDIALANNLSVTDELSAGQVLKLGKTDFQNRQIADYYRNRGLKPATAAPAEIFVVPEGIGVWAVGINFIVS